MHAICFIVKGERVTYSNNGRSSICQKEQQRGIDIVWQSTLKMSWLFLAKALESLCGTENCEFFGDLKSLSIRVSAGFIIPSY